MGGEDDPYRLLELSTDGSNVHIKNILIELSSSLLYQRFAEELFPKATEEEQDSLGIWLDDQLSVRQHDESNMLYIRCWSEDPAFAQDLLKAFYSFILRNNRLQYETVSNATIAFLEGRIANLQNDIGELDSRNADFKIHARSFNFRTAYAGEWRNYTRYDNVREAIEAESQVVLSLRDYIERALLEDGVLPLFNTRNSHVYNSIRRYNSTWAVYDKLRQSASTDVGVLHNKRNELAQLRRSILASLELELDALQVQLRKMDGELSKINKGLSDAPQRLAGSYSDQRLLKAKLNTMVLLRLKLEEVYIKRAIYANNYSLIEPADFSPTPVRPRYFYILLFAFGFGLFAPIAFFVFFDKMDYRICHSKEFRKYPLLRIFTMIPYGDSQDEAYNRIRAELFYVLKNVKVIFFTSTLPHEGKTYTARNIAISLAKSGRKVILVDADIRKATQSRELELDHKHGVSTYLSGDDPDVDKLIQLVPGYSNLSFLPCGMIPTSPSELLVKPKWESLIGLLKEQYEYVVVDSVPAQLIADAMVSARVADISFYVLRHQMIDRRYLPMLNQLFQKELFPNMYLLLNGFDIHEELGN